MFFKLFILLSISFVAAQYNIGVGIHDITGPAAEVGMMGYAQMSQRTKGIHTRLFARSFIIEDQKTKSRVVFVNLDTLACMQYVKMEVVKQLQLRFGDLYSISNVACHAQHTHSGPAGYSHYVLYNVMSLGFEQRQFSQLVNGIVESISRAHNNMKPGRIKINLGKLYKANINRSPSSYEMNPIEEREKYPDGDTNKDHYVLRFEEESGKEIGMISFFSVHSTSVNNTNRYISSDNKGVAELLFEEYKNGKSSLPGKGKFIAAFGQLPEGDASPNILGAFCPDGKDCSRNSTCKGGPKYCHGKGPGKDHFESSYIIAKRQFESALQLYNEAKYNLNGPIDTRHVFVNMSNIVVDAKYTSTGRNEKTCLPALGMSFAAGATDGPGGWWFEQGINGSDSNPFWRWVMGFIKKPSKEQIACQSPKPIFLDVSMEYPYLWVPDVVPLQLMRIGELFLVNYPGEITTMAGRRIQNAIYKTLKSSGIVKEPIIIVLPLTNAYTHYVTTYEEYIPQRYEAACTLWGPHQLAAYIQEMDKLAIAMIKGIPVPIGQLPKNLTKDQIGLNPGVVWDSHPKDAPFGTVYLEPRSTYRKGERVVVEFWSGNLKNDFLTERTFFTIEKQIDDNWKVIKTDASLNTFIEWNRHYSGIFPHSRVTITWDISNEDDSGTYRIRHFGYAKPSPFSSNLVSYEGTTKTFIVE